MKKLHWLFAVLMTFIWVGLPFGSTARASDGSTIAVTLDSRPLYFDVSPRMIDGRVMVPLRAIFESLGAEVGWDGATQTITGQKEGLFVTLRLNDTQAEVGGKSVSLDVAAVQIDGRTFVPARFVAESFGAEVAWDDVRQQVGITTGAAAPDGRYYFVYNSDKVTDEDMGAIRLFANKFNQTYNVLLDAAPYKTAVEVYDALKEEQQKLGGTVAGVQIFGIAQDVPAFPYIHKMKVMEDNGRWNGIENNTEDHYVTDFFYSTFQNDSSHLRAPVSVYSMIQESLPVTIIPAWPVSRLPLTMGEFSSYISRYGEYRQQTAGQSIPTVALSAPTVFQDGYAQNDIALFLKRLKAEPEFSLFQQTDLRIYYKDLAASFTKENKAGVVDLVVGSDGDGEGAVQNHVPFLDRKHLAMPDSHYYTAFFWFMAPAKGLDTDSMIHEGLTKGAMINPISSTTFRSNGNVQHYIWAKVPAPEGEAGDNWYDYIPANKELLEQTTTPYFFIYKYYEALNSGKTRLASFHEAKTAYAGLSVSNKANLGAAHGYEYVISLHYLGLADY